MNSNTLDKVAHSKKVFMVAQMQNDAPFANFELIPVSQIFGITISDWQICIVSAT